VAEREGRREERKVGDGKAAGREVGKGAGVREEGREEEVREEGREEEEREERSTGLRSRCSHGHRRNLRRVRVRHKAHLQKKHRPGKNHYYCIDKYPRIEEERTVAERAAKGAKGPCRMDSNVQAHGELWCSKWD
jgi:hypothetical protein